MTRPNVTVKSFSKFPARVTADTGLSLTVANGAYNFGFDFIGLTTNTSLASPEDWTTLVYNTSTGLYEQVRMDAIVDYTIAPRRSIGNSNATLVGTDRYVGLTASLTTPRTWTLPAANSVSGGVNISIYDEVGGISSTNTLTIAADGSDTVNGSATLAFRSAYEGAIFFSDGISKWTAQRPAATSAQLAGQISDETGTGSLVFANSPTLVTPALGTPSSGNLANCILPAGTVLQVVAATTSTTHSNATATYADTNLTASITPKFSTSKILVTISQCVDISSASAQAAGGIQLLRNSTPILVPVTDTTGPYELRISSAGATAVSNTIRHSMCYLDSPSTTFSTTYKTQSRAYTTASTIICQPTDTTNGTSTIILIEIAA